MLALLLKTTRPRNTQGAPIDEAHLRAAHTDQLFHNSPSLEREAWQQKFINAVFRALRGVAREHGVDEGRGWRELKYASFKSHPPIHPKTASASQSTCSSIPTTASTWRGPSACTTFAASPTAAPLTLRV